MLVYPAERDAGLHDRLLAGRSVAVVNRAVPAAALPPKAAGFAAASNLRQPDLFPVKSLLVSTGFNLNGDYFDPDEVWAARRTPEDKPDNLLHDRDRVVGHTTDVEARDAGGSLLADDAAPPRAFALWDTGVVYRFTGSDATQADRDKFIEELTAGEWWVSMEVWFPHFDYALVPPPATGRWVDADPAAAEFVPRTAKTAHLTKCLQAYGGSGLHGGRAVARVLRGLTFAGKGYVREPANPDSAVYALDGTPLSAAAGRPAAAAVYPPSTPEAAMTDTEKLTKDLADARAELAKAQAAGTEAKLAEAAARADKAEADLKVAAAELAATAARADKAEASLAAAAEALAAVTAERDALAAAKAKADSETALAALTGRVKAAYGVDDAKAAALAATLTPLPADKLDAHLAAAEAVVKAAPPAPKAPAPDLASAAALPPAGDPPVVPPAPPADPFAALTAAARTALNLKQ